MAVSAQRTAKIGITVDPTKMDPGVREAKRKMRLMAREQEKAAKDAERADARKHKQLQDRTRGAGSSLIGAAKGVGFGLAAAAGFDLAGGLGGLVSNVFDVEKELTRFGIDAQLSAAQLGVFRDATRFTSEATGQSQLAIIEAAHAYQILTGDAAGAISQTRLFAEVANASGASMHDIADVGASLNKNLGIDPKNFREGFDVLLTMGHKASVELRDFAAEMSTLNPLFKDFGTAAPQKKLEEMAATLEVTKYNFANASEASAGFRAAMSQISKTKPAERLAEHGVKVWEMDPKTKTHVKRDYLDIVKDIHDKIKDRKVLADILGGRQESYRAITAQLDHYDELIALKDKSANSDQVAKDNATYMESTTGRLARAWEHVKNAVAAAFTPERIDKFTNALVSGADAASSLIGFLSQIPALMADEEKAQKTGEYGDESKDIAHNEVDKLSDATAVEKRQRATELRKMAAEAAYGAGADDDDNYIVATQKLQRRQRASGYRQAADQLSLAANNHQHGDGNAFLSRIPGKGVHDRIEEVGNRQSAEIVAAMKAFTEKTVATLKNLTVVVKADSNAIAKTGSNAPIHSRRPGGHD